MNKKISASALVEFCKSPKHFKWYVDRKKETTDAMKFGTAFHLAMLEPEKFMDRVKTMESLSGQVLILKNKEDFAAYLDKKQIPYGKKALKDELVEMALAARKEYEFYLESEAKDKYIVLSDDKMASLFQMSESAENHKFHKTNKGFGQKELKLEGVIDGITFVGKLDHTFKKNKTNFVVDYKTCQSVASRDFFYKVVREKYFVQMSVYNELLKQNFEGVDRIKNIWFGVETNEPYVCQAFTMAESSAYDSDLYMRQKIHELKIVLEKQDYFGYTNENYETIEIPNYAYENVFDLEPNGKES